MSGTDVGSTGASSRSIIFFPMGSTVHIHSHDNGVHCSLVCCGCFRQMHSRDDTCSIFVSHLPGDSSKSLRCTEDNNEIYQTHTWTLWTSVRFLVIMLLKHSFFWLTVDFSRTLRLLGKVGWGPDEQIKQGSLSLSPASQNHDFKAVIRRWLDIQKLLWFLSAVQLCLKKSSPHSNYLGWELLFLVWGSIAA